MEQYYVVNCTIRAIQPLRAIQICITELTETSRHILCSLCVKKESHTLLPRSSQKRAILLCMQFQKSGMPFSYWHYLLLNLFFVCRVWAPENSAPRRRASCLNTWHLLCRRSSLRIREEAVSIPWSPDVVLVHGHYNRKSLSATLSAFAIGGWPRIFWNESSTVPGSCKERRRRRSVTG